MDTLLLCLSFPFRLLPRRELELKLNKTEVLCTELVGGWGRKGNGSGELKGVIRGQFKGFVLKDGPGEINCFHVISFSEIALLVCSFSSCLCAARPPPWRLRASLFSVASFLKASWSFFLSGGMAF